MPNAQHGRVGLGGPPALGKVGVAQMHAHPSSRSAGRPPVRSMALTWASAVVPGLALTTSRTELLRMAVRPGWLTIVIVVALAVALAWVVLVTGSYRVLGPVRQTGVAQVGVILALTVLSLLV